MTDVTKVITSTLFKSVGFTTLNLTIFSHTDLGLQGIESN